MIIPALTSELGVMFGISTANCIFSLISQKLILLMRFFGSDICAWGSYLRENSFSSVDNYTKKLALFHRGIMPLLEVVSGSSGSSWFSP